MEGFEVIIKYVKDDIMTTEEYTSPTAVKRALEELRAAGAEVVEIIDNTLIVD